MKACQDPLLCNGGRLDKALYCVMDEVFVKVLYCVMDEGLLRSFIV